MKTMISNLPNDLIEEILYKVPLKFLRAVRLTCTKWNALSRSQSFTKMYIDEAPAAEPQMIGMMDYKLYSMSVFVNRCGKLKGQRICLDKQVKISHVIHCEGLLLCMLKEDDTKVLVWNPYCREKTWIETRFSHQGEGHSGWSMKRCNYALGNVNKNNKSCRSYKILRIFDGYVWSPGSSPTHAGQFLWYEIYDFDSGLWTTLEIGTPHWRIRQTGISLKGNTYWCASQRNSVDKNHIICFDFMSERFGPLLPMPFSVGVYDDYVTLSSVREEKLAVLLTHNEINFQENDIWITTKIEAENISWSKFLKLSTKHYYPISRGSFFIDEEEKIATGLNEWEAGKQHVLNIVGEAKYFEKVFLGERAKETCTSTHGCYYVPSLVQLKQPAEGKRKRQSDLEKRRYDEKMSRLVELKREKPVN